MQDAGRSASGLNRRVLHVLCSFCVGPSLNSSARHIRTWQVKATTQMSTADLMSS